MKETYFNIRGDVGTQLLKEGTVIHITIKSVWMGVLVQIKNNMKNIISYQLSYFSASPAIITHPSGMIHLIRNMNILLKK